VQNRPRRLVIIVKRRPFDEAAWKRLLLAYAYAKYDQQKKKIAEPAAASEEAQS
jgi:hypothetical protein